MRCRGWGDKVISKICCHAGHADRQRTLRELEVGRTLVREGGRWLVRHQAGDYKTGRAYGERPPLVIAPAIYPEVDAPGHTLLGSFSFILKPFRSASRQ